MLVANRPDLSDIPLVVLTAGRTGPSPLPPDIVERLDQVRQDTQEELLSLSTNSTHVLVEDSGHGIPQERPNVVIAAIRQVLDEVRGGKTAAAYRGEIILYPNVAQKLLEYSPPAQKPQPPGLPYEQLTQRELQVLQLAAQGLSNKEIAGDLVISEKTAKNHIANIFSKLQVNDRTQAILYALRKGLVAMPQDEN